MTRDSNILNKKHTQKKNPYSWKETKMEEKKQRKEGASYLSWAESMNKEKELLYLKQLYEIRLSPILQIKKN